jgi:hypothetical protein
VWITPGMPFVKMVKKSLMTSKDTMEWVLFFFLVWCVLMFTAYATSPRRDRNAFAHMVRLGRLSASCATRESILGDAKLINYIWRILTFPFAFIYDEHAFARVSQGALYDFQYVSDSVVKWSEDKLATGRALTHMGVVTPHLYAYTTSEGEIIRLTHIPPGTRVVIKPRRGCLGKGVRFVSSDQLDKHLKDQPDLLVQEYVRANHMYRVITLWNGSVFRIYTFAPSPGVHQCQPRPSKNEPPPQVISTIGTVHRRDFPSLFSIGWDIMGDKVLEMNLGHSALPMGCVTHTDIGVYKQCLKVFERERNRFHPFEGKE